MADGEHVRERALGALAAVVALALGVSVLLAAGAYAAARMVGLTGDGGEQPTTQAVATPSHSPSATPSASPRVPAAGSPSQAAQPTRQPKPHRPAQHQQQTRPDRQHRKPQAHARRHRQHRRHRQQQATGTVSLHAAQTRVRPMARIDLAGRCGCGSGTTLVVQRLEHGHWSRFPATATASGGRFHTWVMTGRSGANQFRVVVPGGRASNPVTITVG